MGGRDKDTIYCAKRGNAAPAVDRSNVFAAIADAALNLHMQLDIDITFIAFPCFATQREKLENGGLLIKGSGAQILTIVNMRQQYS